ncbi:hypothetical protein MMC10_010101 [Thelotrema lepadinum]|nr:hypothetical protein [Thelotrema lepadinum]
MSASLRKSISVGWPTWRQQCCAKFTITADDIYRTYEGHQEDSKPIFQKACRWLDTIHLENEEMTEDKGALLYNELQENMCRAVYGSNFIERVGLDFDSTMNLCRRIFVAEELLKDFDPQSPDHEEHFRAISPQHENLIGRPSEAFGRGRREVAQHAEAMKYLLDAFVVEGNPMTEELILNTHHILCSGISIVHYKGADTPASEYAGKYRTIPVSAGNTMFTTPTKVPDAMRRFVEDLAADIAKADQTGFLDPFSLASKCCLEFVQIHPFQDGNGRMCRLILNAILCRYVGIVVPIGETEENRSDYLDIKKRASATMEGYGELAMMVLKKGEVRLRAIKKKLAGKKKMKSESKR